MVYQLAHLYDERKIPLPFGRTFDVENFSFDPEESPSQAFNEGFVSGSLDQIGTQFDALGHAGHDQLGFYNCLRQSDLGPDEYGRLRKLGVENVRPFFTRALLLDFVNNSDVPKITVGERRIVKDSYVITLDDVREVLQTQRLTPPATGDVVLFYTGWDSLFGVDNARFSFSPGPGIEVANWLASRKVALVGADTQAVEAVYADDSVEVRNNPQPFGSQIGTIF